MRKATISFVLSVRLSLWNSLLLLDEFLMKFGIRVFLETLSRKLNFPYSVTRTTGTVRKDVFIFMIKSR